MLVFWINKIAFFQQIVLIKDALNGNYDHLCFGGYPRVGKVSRDSELSFVFAHRL